MSVNNTTADTEKELIEYREVIENINVYVTVTMGSTLFILGMIFNVLSFTYFQVSRSFRDTSMRHYFSVISITDSLRLTEWLLATLVDKKMVTPNRTICSIYLFTFMASGTISVWLLVLLSIERFTIMQFPFRGKQFYTQSNSLRLLIIVIILIVLVNLTYFLTDFISQPFVDHQVHLFMCVTSLKYRTFINTNNLFVYSFVPFVILLVFNCLLINLLARQKSQLLNIIQQTDNQNQVLNAKRDRQFKERTILLMLVTFFLVLTVAPRYVLQMLFMHQMLPIGELSGILIMKCLIVLEMLNFSLNFFFYIICSKTSRNELKLILYYYFYWKWSEKSKNIMICNHPNHNRNFKNNNFQAGQASSLLGSLSKQVYNSNPVYYQNHKNSINHHTNSHNNNNYEYEPGYNFVTKKNSGMKIHCFLINASRLKLLQKGKVMTGNSHNRFNNTQTTTNATSANPSSLAESHANNNSIKLAINNAETEKDHLLLSTSSVKSKSTLSTTSNQARSKLSKPTKCLFDTKLSSNGGSKQRIDTTISSSQLSLDNSQKNPLPDKSVNNQTAAASNSGEATLLPKSISNNSLTWRIIEKKRSLSSFGFDDFDNDAS